MTTTAAGAAASSPSSWSPCSRSAAGPSSCPAGGARTRGSDSRLHLEEAPGVARDPGLRRLLQLLPVPGRGCRPGGEPVPGEGAVPDPEGRAAGAVRPGRLAGRAVRQVPRGDRPAELRALLLHAISRSRRRSGARRAPRSRWSG